MSTADANKSRRPPPHVHGSDPLDLPGWIPSQPPVVSRRPPMRRTPRRRAAARERSRARAIALCAVVGAFVTGVASVVGGVPLVLLGSGENARGRSAAAGVGVGARSEVNQENPSSVAITAEAGPFQPVRVDGRIDYGDAGAGFGADRAGHTHEGQDIFAKPGTPLIAVRDGIVIEMGNDGGRGNYVAIHDPGQDLTYVYLHMLRPTSLEPGDRVTAGGEVGAMGCTGSCFGTHLHFEVRRGNDVEGKPLDPLPMLKKWPQAARG